MRRTLVAKGLMLSIDRWLWHNISHKGQHQIVVYSTFNLKISFSISGARLFLPLEFSFVDIGKFLCWIIEFLPCLLTSQFKLYTFVLSCWVESVSYFGENLPWLHLVSITRIMIPNKPPFKKLSIVSAWFRLFRHVSLETSTIQVLYHTVQNFSLEIQEILRKPGSNETDWFFRKTCILNGNIFVCCNIYLTRVYLFKVNNRNIRAMCELFSKLRVKTPKQFQWRRSGVFAVNF